MTTSIKISRKLRNMIAGLALVAVLTISAWLCGIFNGTYVQRWRDEREEAQPQADAKAVFNAAVKQCAKTWTTPRARVRVEWVATEHAGSEWRR
jgi:hypothetical protein